MSKPTASTAGGAMPREPDPSKMSDQLDIIKGLVDAAFMASNELTDFHREAFRRLLDDTSSKVGEVQKDFTEFYCGEPAGSDPDPKRELLQVVDDIDEVRCLMEAARVAADSISEEEEQQAIQTLLRVAKRQLTDARNKLNIARGRPAEDRADV